MVWATQTSFVWCWPHRYHWYNLCGVGHTDHKDLTLVLWATQISFVWPSPHKLQLCFVGLYLSSYHMCGVGQANGSSAHEIQTLKIDNQVRICVVWAAQMTPQQNKMRTLKLQFAWRGPCKEASPNMRCLRFQWFSASAEVWICVVWATQLLSQHQYKLKMVICMVWARQIDPHIVVLSILFAVASVKVSSVWCGPSKWLFSAWDAKTQDGHSCSYLFGVSHTDYAL